ncbi:hypothetical protein D9M72_405740 [compost metagenome]
MLGGIANESNGAFNRQNALTIQVILKAEPISPVKLCAAFERRSSFGLADRDVP